MQRNIIQTKDGSSSLYVPDLNEHYHSTNGAAQESMHVFINAGLLHINKSNLKVFELGYGTGLNFILTYLNRKDLNIEYHCIEAYPLEGNIIQELNYPEILNLSTDERNVFYEFHGKSNNLIFDNMSVVKSNLKFNEYEFPGNIDLVYFDAFAPNVQPELWKTAVFEKLFNSLNPGGVLTTYCAKGVVRRTMQSCGFIVERLPGPPGKREMLRATKPIA